MNTCSDIKCEPITCGEYFGDIPISFNKIMSNIQASNDRDEIKLYCDYLNEHKKRFPLVQLWFAMEFVDEKMRKLNK